MDNHRLIFGERSIYFDIKRRVKSEKGNINSIPDGYVISFSSSSPKLYIIENEISTHDVYADIGLQLWRFASSFKTGSRKIKNFLLDEIKRNQLLSDELKELMDGRFPNFSELLDEVIFENEYGFIVLIDEASEDLNFVLRQLATQPDVIELRKYVSDDQVAYQFSEFQEEIKESLSKRVRDISDIDTIVCPANKEGFEAVFLGENKWYQIRISPSVIPQIKYIAMYETAPISGINWVGTVQSIRPHGDSGKFEVILSSKEKLDNPVMLAEDEAKRGLAPRGPRYTRLDLIKKATKLGDVF